MNGLFERGGDPNDFITELQFPETKFDVLTTNGN